jgi:uncharacterized repeat protein (TIGR01451 family)
VYKLIKSIAFVFVLGMSLLGPRYVGAQYYSEGGSKKTIIIDKRVGFEKGIYFDNIDKGKHVFSQDETIYFKIVVENNGNSDLSNLDVLDMLPSGLKLIYNPGKLTSSKDRLDWEINQLGIGQTKVYEISAKIEATSKTNLKTNYVEVSGDGTNDSDRASYWVGGKTMPVTGTQDLIALSMIFMGMGGIGATVRKLVRGY